MLDLVVNAVGAFVISVAGYVYLKEGRGNLISRAITNFVEKNPILFRSERNPDERVDKVLRMIKGGESENVEFKSTLRKNFHTGQYDKKIEHASLKTISAFLNSDGGTLILGVTDAGEISGIEQDEFPSDDKFVLHFTNLVKNQIGKELFSFIHLELVRVEGKTILRVDCKKSDREVFLKSGQAEEFFIRSGPSSVRLEGAALVDYVTRRFRKA